VLLWCAPAALASPSSPVHVTGTVAATAPDGSGGYYIGGSFTAVDGVPINNAAHILANGSLDQSWNPDPTGCGYSDVRALAVSGSTVYLGGFFCSITDAAGTGTVARDDAAAVSAATGRDTGWDPAPVGPVYALAVSGSTVYLGGEFSRINDPANTTTGGIARNNAAAVSATTGLDTGWNPNPNGYVAALALSGSTVYLGGRFSSITDSTGTTTVTRYHAAAVNATTGHDTGWNPDPYFGKANPNSGSVNALAVSGTTVYIGGYFTAIAGATPTARVPRDNAAAVNATTGGATGWDPNPNNAVNAIAVSGSTVYLGGYFGLITGPAGTIEEIDSGAAAVNATTGLGTGWSDSLGTVNAIAASGSTVYAGGASFATAASTAPTGAAITRIKSHHNGNITLKLDTPGRGRLKIVATAPPNHGVFARERLKARRRGALQVLVKPSAAGTKLLRRHHKLKLALSITYTPTGGKPHTLSYSGLPLG